MSNLTRSAITTSIGLPVGIFLSSIIFDRVTAETGAMIFGALVGIWMMWFWAARGES